MDCSLAEIYTYVLKRTGFPESLIPRLVSAQMKLVVDSPDPVRSEDILRSQLALTSRYLDSVCESCVQNFRSTTKDICQNPDICSQYFEAFVLEQNSLRLIN